MSFIKNKTVAVVVPMYRGDISSDEQISLRHLRHYLGKYDKYIVAPQRLHLADKYSDFYINTMDGKHFESRESYSRLLLSKSFYETFRDYEYILIYQLDSLVFSDQLLEWCKKGYDYIGAPWYKEGTSRPMEWAPDNECVGNGGFSLRKVESHLKVLDAYNADYMHNEDIFWSFIAKQFCFDFKVAPPDVAVSFSFETGPRFCFKKNNQKLPFGCHGWAKDDRKFWEPNLLDK